MAEAVSEVVVGEVQVGELEIGDATDCIACDDGDSLLDDDEFQVPQALRILMSAEQQR